MITVTSCLFNIAMQTNYLDMINTMIYLLQIVIFQYVSPILSAKSWAGSFQAPIAGDDPGPVPHLRGPGVGESHRKMEIYRREIGFQDDSIVSYGIAIGYSWYYKLVYN